jgi:hypothetical protein
MALHYECKQAPDIDEWFVEAIDYGSEGEVYQVDFAGPSAQARAEEYATWKNGAGGEEKTSLDVPSSRITTMSVAVNP